MSAETATAVATMPEPTEEELKTEALHQVEFYFADSNLPFDRFMWGLHIANDDHWVPIATVASFKRMRLYSDKYGLPWVVAVLRSSESLEVDEAGENVRRKTEVQEPVGQFERTAYVKGFGDDKENQLALERFFKQFGAVAAVRIRRDDKKVAKDSCFVEFAAPADLERFLAVDPKPKWKDAELVIKTKEDYCRGKLEEKGLPLSELDKMRSANTSHPRQRGGFNAFRDPKAAKAVAKGPKKPEVYIKYLDNDIRVYRYGETDTKVKFEDHQWVLPSEVPHVPGTALQFTGFGDHLEFAKVKTALKEAGVEPTPYIEFKRGQTAAYLIFIKVVDDALFETVKIALPKIGENELTWSRAEKEVEHRLEQERANAIGQRALGDDAKPSTFRAGRGGARGGGRGGRGGGRGGRGGRGGGRAFDRNAEKASKTESAEVKMDTDEAAAGGVKRKRDQVEPDGGVTQGVRGAGVPTIGRAEKKPKTEG